eukprot:m.61068 g.61068  ORF g.61068 m.61068 type:complete len:301 (-) comp13174_c0_seq1:253-1155(-)
MPDGLAASLQSRSAYGSRPWENKRASPATTVSSSDACTRTHSPITSSNNPPGGGNTPPATPLTPAMPAPAPASATYRASVCCQAPSVSARWCRPLTNTHSCPSRSGDERFHRCSLAVASSSITSLRNAGSCSLLTNRGQSPGSGTSRNRSALPSTSSNVWVTARGTSGGDDKAEAGNDTPAHNASPASSTQPILSCTSAVSSSSQRPSRSVLPVKMAEAPDKACLRRASSNWSSASMAWANRSRSSETCNMSASTLPRNSAKRHCQSTAFASPKPADSNAGCTLRFKKGSLSSRSSSTNV